ncbi:optic atrophy 3 protein-like protein [Iris pallida]|uniref:Optic atrophy 3 protein-like protein n=1 Tax=Iris pallida TaxID=29817 RepID=A0AAX6GZ29_IRIPA|nr:optic atrophy 3 protein-like protein [Iris pallida]
MMLPVVKLGTLVLKTIAKPIASRLKAEAGRHPKFRQLIVNIAQVNHRFTTNIQRRIYGHATDVEIRPLNEEKAVQAAGDLLGELFVFSVATAALIFEVQRSARSEARKEEIRQKEIQGVKDREEELAREIEILKQKYAELEQLARGRGLSGILPFRHGNGKPPEASKEAKPA